MWTWINGAKGIEKNWIISYKIKLNSFFSDQGVEQPWYEGLTDYKFGLSGADGNEIQTEWIVPYENGVPAMKAVCSH